MLGCVGKSDCEKLVRTVFGLLILYIADLAEKGKFGIWQSTEEASARGGSLSGRFVFVLVVGRNPGALIRIPFLQPVWAQARIKGDNHEGHEGTRRTLGQLECCREENHLGGVRKDAMKTASLGLAERAGEMSRMLSRAKKYRSRWLGLSSISIGAAVIFLALLTGCSSEPEKPAEPAKPEVKGPELLTARSGFQKTYVAARGWSQDSRPYRLESVVTSDANGRDGKWAAWRASFASPTQRSAKTFVWSGSAADGAPSRGVSFGVEDSYSPTNASTQVWDVQFLKIDSDQALATAQKHGGDKVLEKTPDTQVTYVCDWNHNSNQLIWHVIFGPNRENSKLTVSVDASSGEFIRVEK